MSNFRFHETKYGRNFFNAQLPSLINNVNKLAEAIAKQNELSTIGLQNSELVPSDDKDYMWWSIYESVIALTVYEWFLKEQDFKDITDAVYNDDGFSQSMNEAIEEHIVRYIEQKDKSLDND